MNGLAFFFLKEGRKKKLNLYFDSIVSLIISKLF